MRCVKSMRVFCAKFCRGHCFGCFEELRSPILIDVLAALIMRCGSEALRLYQWESEKDRGIGNKLEISDYVNMVAVAVNSISGNYSSLMKKESQPQPYIFIVNAGKSSSTRFCSSCESESASNDELLSPPIFCHLYIRLRDFWHDVESWYARTPRISCWIYGASSPKNPRQIHYSWSEKSMIAIPHICHFSWRLASSFSLVRTTYSSLERESQRQYRANPDTNTEVLTLPSFIKFCWVTTLVA